MEFGFSRKKSCELYLFAALIWFIKGKLLYYPKLQFCRYHRSYSISPTPLPFNERSVGFASCKTLGVQFRASMPPLEKGEVDWRQGASYIFTTFLCDISDFRNRQINLPSRR